MMDNIKHQLTIDFEHLWYYDILFCLISVKAMPGIPKKENQRDLVVKGSCYSRRIPKGR